MSGILYDKTEEAKSPAVMTAGQINKELDALDKRRSKLLDEMIAAGRGTERWSETAVKTDELALRMIAVSDRTSALRYEITRRYGPGAPSRLPRGFSHIKALREAKPAKAEEAKKPKEADCVPMVKLERANYDECLARAKDIGALNTPHKIYDLLAPRLAKEDQEVVLVVLLDIHTMTRGVVEVARGQRSKVNVALVDVLRVVITQGASAFVLCHNHPSGSAEFSDADNDLTKHIREAVKPFHNEIQFLDHVVIGTNEYYSFTEDELVKVK